MERPDRMHVQALVEVLAKCVQHGFRIMTLLYYPLVNVYILQWKITIFNGKIHYFYGHFQLQTVSSPDGKESL